MDAPNASEVYRCYVGGLAPKTDKKSLREAFDKFGQLQDWMIEHDHTGKSKGYGFVVFATSNGRKNAIANMNGKVVDGSTITVGQVYECYVRGLSYNTDEESLRQAFSEFKDVVQVKIPLDKNTGKSRGFGFVMFSSEEGMRDAIRGMYRQEVDGRRISVNQAGHRESAYECFVGGLAYKTDEESLRQAFSKFGDVLVRIGVNENGESRGFGHVKFSTEEDMKAAIQGMNGKELDGRYIRVDQAGAQSGGDKAQPRGNGGDGGKGGYECFVTGLDTENNYMEDNVNVLNEAFSKFGKIIGVKVPTYKDGYCKGYGFVKFSTEESMKAAIEGMNGQELNSRRITVKQAGNKESGNKESGVNDDSRRRGYRIFVGGFPETSKESLEKTLDKVFSQFGKMTVDVVDGRGFGFVTFDNEEAMKNAIEKKHGKKIHVIDENGKKINFNFRVNEAETKER